MNLVYLFQLVIICCTLNDLWITAFVLSPSNGQCHFRISAFQYCIFRNALTQWGALSAARGWLWASLILPFVNYLKKRKSGHLVFGRSLSQQSLEDVLWYYKRTLASHVGFNPTVASVQIGYRQSRHPDLQYKIKGTLDIAWFVLVQREICLTSLLARSLLLAEKLQPEKLNWSYFIQPQTKWELYTCVINDGVLTKNYMACLWNVNLRNCYTSWPTNAVSFFLFNSISCS